MRAVSQAGTDVGALTPLVPAPESAWLGASGSEFTGLIARGDRLLVSSTASCVVSEHEAATGKLLREVDLGAGDPDLARAGNQVGKIVPEAVPPEASPGAVVGGGETILVADDDAGILSQRALVRVECTEQPLLGRDLVPPSRILGPSPSRSAQHRAAIPHSGSPCAP